MSAKILKSTLAGSYVYAIWFEFTGCELDEYDQIWFITKLERQQYAKFVKNQRSYIHGNKTLQNSTQIPAVDVASCEQSHKS